MRTAIIGGGAAGFFIAVNLKEMMPEMDVTIFERSHRVLAKVEVSGGGRCNVTNSFRGITDLQAVYPRGHRLLKRLFHVFSPQDAYRWFECHDVPLVTQDDECVFPRAQDSHAIIDCFLREAHHHHIEIRTHENMTGFEALTGFDYICVTTGGSPTGKGLQWLANAGHEVVAPVPSLYSLRIDDRRLTALMGTVVSSATTHIAGTKLRAEGPLLITHWGVSGPAVLRLSSYAARLLADADYRLPLTVNWTSQSDADVMAAIHEAVIRHPQKQLATFNPFGLPQRLWGYLAERALGDRQRLRWSELGRKDLNRLVNVLSADTYSTAGRAPFKDEFVTCGGIALDTVNLSTLESRHVPRLYFAGEVLDIDGVTGGFNFQAAWTTAYTVAKAIARTTAS